ncbi:MAG: hypothetical protein SGJ17_00075 [Hyphomicrobiales bacterium]|nr:hypothetical protein [Hyphomicrobiales bacterium]
MRRFGVTALGLKLIGKKMAHGNKNPDDDITRTSKQARQGDQSNRTKWILVGSLLLAVVAYFVLAGVFKIGF